MTKVREYEFIDLDWAYYFIETTKKYKKWDKIYDNDFKMDLEATWFVL